MQWADFQKFDDCIESTAIFLDSSAVEQPAVNR